jgi:hypothetical protein
MDTARVAAGYDRLLASIGEHADEIADRPVVTHWPHVGSAYQGLAIVGQAVFGWDDDRRARELRSPSTRSQLISDIRARAEVAEPLGWIQGHARENTPFWRTMRTFAEMLEPESAAPWFARFAWFELYPSAPEAPPGNPTGPLKVAQDPYVGELLRDVCQMIDANRVILTVGNYWWPAAGTADLVDLQEMPRPLLRAGHRHGRTWVVGWHPTGASYRGIRPPAYARIVGDVLEKLGRET